MSIILRADKGTALTYDEADENWAYLERTKHDRLSVEYSGIFYNPKVTVDSTGQIIAIESAGELTPGSFSNPTITVNENGIISQIESAGNLTTGIYGTSARIPVVTVDESGIISEITDIGLSIAPGSPAQLTVEGSNGLTGTGTISLNQTDDATITLTHDATSSAVSSTNSANTFIQSVDIDQFGHVTGFSTAEVNQTNFFIQNDDSTRVEVSDQSEIVITQSGGVDVNITDNGTGHLDLTIGHANTSSATSVENTDGTVIQSVAIDSYGHTTEISSIDLDQRYDNYSNWKVQNTVGADQFTVSSLDGVRFEGGGDTSVTFDSDTNTISIVSITGSGGTPYDNYQHWAVHNSTDTEQFLVEETDSIKFIGAGSTTVSFDAVDKSITFSSPAYATQTYVNTAINDLINSAPSTLDTLNELAASLNDDADFAGTMTTALATKANSADLATVATSGAYSDLSGTPTLATVATSGAYSDLSGTPSIPESGTDFDPVGTDNSTDVTLSGSYDYLTISGQTITLNLVDASTDIAGLADVATSGAYSDLTGTPTVQTPAITSNGSTPSLNTGITGAEVRSLIGAGTSSFSGAYSALTGTPYEVEVVEVSTSGVTYLEFIQESGDIMIELEFNNILPESTTNNFLRVDMSTNGGSSWISGDVGATGWHWAYVNNGSLSRATNSYGFMYAGTDHYRLGSNPYTGEPGINGTMRWDLNNLHRFGNTTYGQRTLYYDVSGHTTATAPQFTKGYVGLMNYNQSIIPNAFRLYWSGDTWYPGSRIIVKRYKS